MFGSLSSTIWTGCCCLLFLLGTLSTVLLVAADDVGKNAGDVFKVETVEKPSECEQVSENGMTLKVHFTGYFNNGTQFDTSRGGHNVPFIFVLGGQRVIEGWNLGLVGMCVGEKRYLTIPPHLGYAEDGFGSVIGPDEVIFFDIELIAISDDPPIEDSFRFENIDLDRDGFLQHDEVGQYLDRMSQYLEEIAMEMDTLNGKRKLVNMVMKKHDANGDGKLSQDEFYKRLPDDDEDRDEL